MSLEQVFIGSSVKTTLHPSFIYLIIHGIVETCMLSTTRRRRHRFHGIWIPTHIRHGIFSIGRFEYHVRTGRITMILLYDM